MSCDPDERRDTPLARKLKERIRRDGPISVAEYMQACLQDPEHGYYRNQPAIGAGGDFVTAPEISQVFGELIGLWCAVVWRQMGSPARLNLVELGPGRGTLMRDALRAARIVPGFPEVLTVHLVESNAALRKAQQATLAGIGVPLQLHADPPASLMQQPPAAESPTVLIANEFLDTLPIEQFEYRGSAWRARRIAVDDERLVFVTDMTSASELERLPRGTEAQEGDVFEVPAFNASNAEAILGMSARCGPLAALFIDYGHLTTDFGDTLQGMAGQAYASPFFAPGETDLTAHVDFQHFAEECRNAGLATDGPVTQSEFLGSLGIMERASRLMAANPGKAAAIEAGVARLMSPTGMGSRFKAIGVRSPSLPSVPGFASVANSG
jgi:SAM-dependent MidA family methyltransferase